MERGFEARGRWWTAEASNLGLRSEKNNGCERRSAGLGTVRIINIYECVVCVFGHDEASADEHTACGGGGLCIGQGMGEGIA